MLLKKICKTSVTPIWMAMRKNDDPLSVSSVDMMYMQMKYGSYIFAFSGGTERSGMQSMERNRTEEEFSSRLVRLKITFSRFPQNCSYLFRPKVDFQAERFKLLKIRSVPLRHKRQVQMTLNK
uniref:Uncharacterized protein n=1 Tax=Romanomermis culicivorax TaxID=13658 RepID=A0A915K649_ROMCU